MHASEKHFDDYQVGEVIPAPSRTITETDVVNFAGLAADYHPLHVDEEFARKSQFGQRIAHGMLSFVVMSGLLYLAGVSSDKSMAFLGIRDWNFKAPVFIGDTLTVRITVVDKHASKKPDRGVLTFHCEVLNVTRSNEVACEGKWVQMYRRKQAV